jgi:hypothetical protein
VKKKTIYKKTVVKSVAKMLSDKEAVLSILKEKQHSMS